MITNLCPDSTQQLEVAISSTWQNKVIEELNTEGKWQPAQHHIKNNITIINGESNYMTPRLFRLI
jgi:hypothetical protein